MVDSRDTEVNTTDTRGPCFQGAHILVQERDNDKVTKYFLIFTSALKTPSRT